MGKNVIIRVQGLKDDEYDKLIKNIREGSNLEFPTARMVNNYDVTIPNYMLDAYPETKEVADLLESVHGNYYDPTVKHYADEYLKEFINKGIYVGIGDMDIDEGERFEGRLMSISVLEDGPINKITALIFIDDDNGIVESFTINKDTIFHRDNKGSIRMETNKELVYFELIPETNE